MPERPTRLEIGGSLLACLAALFLLALLDDASLRRHQAAPPPVAAQPATPLPGDTPAVMPSRAPVSVAVEDVPGRAMALGWLALVAAGGIGMCAVGVAVLRRRWA